MLADTILDGSFEQPSRPEYTAGRPEYAGGSRQDSTDSGSPPTPLVDAYRSPANRRSSISSTSNTLNYILNPDESSVAKRTGKPVSTGGVKFHKSCNYCRHRKVKCEVLENSTECEHCKLCGVPCVFSRKEKSQKRRMKSAQIAAAIQGQPAHPPRSQSGSAHPPLNGSGSVPPGQGQRSRASGSGPSPGYEEAGFPSNSGFSSNSAYSSSYGTHHLVGVVPFQNMPQPALYETRRPDAPPSGPQSAISPSSAVSYSPRERQGSGVEEQMSAQPSAGYGLSPPSNQYTELLGMTNPSNPRAKAAKGTLKSIYKLQIEPFSPFLPESALDGPENISKLTRCCVSLASVSSPEANMTDTTRDLLHEMFYYLVDRESEWNEVTLGSILIHAVRSKISADLHSTLMAQINAMPMLSDPATRAALLLGAMAVDTWTSLVDNTRPHLDPQLLCGFDELVATIDDNTFAHHFLLLSYTLFNVLTLVHEPQPLLDDKELKEDNSRTRTWRERRYRLLQLESELLIWPVKLPKHLTVVKDELIAPNEAVILHVLHNTATLALYNFALNYPSTTGKQMCLVPVPGLLQFMSGMAKSTFKCGGHMHPKWPILRQCQVLTARYMLELYNQVEYEFCKRALAWWTDEELDPELFGKVKALLGGVDWTEYSDGAVVFWVYRDARSTAVELFLSDARDRGFLD
ncbi:hypothetical protein TRVA0_046S01112 [Trichomonascus vanleenenianus]|uniref:uncharacterized protein n=1 Tax=Trichomonascus vanleenenianus TaxID=2268995 RepID=UPI003ECAE125